MARTSSQLKPDVQRALQHAIGEVNNAASSSTAADGPTKKRKRKAKDTAETTEPQHAVNMNANRLSTDTGAVDTTDDAEGGNRKKKRKKGSVKTRTVESVVPRKEERAPGTNATSSKKKIKKPVGKRRRDQSYSDIVIDPLLEENDSEDANWFFSPDGEHSGTTESNVVPSKKKKKKSVEKPAGKRRPGQSHLDVVIDPLLEENDSGDANAFLSAVMTAAAASSSSSSPSAAAMSAAQQILHASQPHLPSTGYTYYPTPYGAPGFPSAPPNQMSGFSPDALGFHPSLSGEELARAVQNIDLSKLANAIRILGDNAASVTFPLPGQTGPCQLGTGRAPLPSNHTNVPIYAYGHRTFPPPLPMGQVPAPSALILGQSMHIPEHSSSRIPTTSMFVDQESDHAYLLANKWLSATKLNELVRTRGLIYKKGKFSTSEEVAIRDAIESYREKNTFTDEQVNEIIFAKGSKDSTFWFEITSHVPQRPVVAVYHHVRRSYHPLKQQGKWMPSEDDSLRQAVTELGQAWEKVSSRVGRMAGDCRDRWRNHINNSNERIMGSWSKEEEDRLTLIVTEMTIAKGKNADQDVFWTQVAERMGNTRSRNQCRIKWTDALSKTVKNEGQKPRWSQQDAFILVHKIASLNVRDDSEIDWKLLADDDWNLWSAHSLQRRWLTLKRSVRGHEEMTHQEIMDILRVKKAHAPPVHAPVKVRVTSTPMVPIDHQLADVQIDNCGRPVAGPSEFVHSTSQPEPAQPEPVQQHFTSMMMSGMQGTVPGAGIRPAVFAEARAHVAPEAYLSSSDSDSDSSGSD